MTMVNMDSDTFFMYIAKEISSVEETEANINIFRLNLENNKECFLFYVAVVRDENNAPSYMNMAALLARFDKRVFLSILAEELPDLLWQRVFNSDENVALTTPIDAAIQSRDPLSLLHVLGLTQLREYSLNHKPEFLSLIDNAIENDNKCNKGTDDEKLFRMMLVAVKHGIWPKNDFFVTLPEYK